MAIPLTAGRGPIEFRPPSLYPKDANGIFLPRKRDVVILIRVPTPYERDSFAAALVRGGVIHYSRRQIRDILMAGVVAQHTAEEFDQIRADLEELFAVSDEEQRVQQMQMKRLQELYDVPEGAEPPSPEQVQRELDQIVPEIKMDPQKRARTVAIQQHITSTYPPLQKAYADMAEQDARRSWLQVELYVEGFKGLEHEPAGNGRGGLLRHEVEYLRRQIGADAWNELNDFITALHGIDEDEEKNLDSLLVSMSAQIGSTANPSSASSENGSSTAEPTSPTQEDASPKMTESSSDSTKSSETTMDLSASTRMAADSLTSLQS